MKQEYHSNAVTNVHIRSQIRKSGSTNFELAMKYNTSEATSIWRNRKDLSDRASRLNKVRYALDDVERPLAVSLRRTTWLPLDEAWEALLAANPKIRGVRYYLYWGMHLKHIKKVSILGVMRTPKNQIEFEKMFTTEEQCLDYLKELRFPNGYFCRKCQHEE